MIRDDLTLIVPTRNEARNITAFLRSIPSDLPLIVVDTSEDQTPVLIRAQRPHHTQLFHWPGQVAQARQMGAEAARTRWLLFTDADIVFAPDYFERLSCCQNLDAVYGPKLSNDRFDRYYRWVARGQQFADRLGVPAVSGSNLIVRRDAFRVTGGFDLTLTCNEDSELGWRIKRASFRIAFAPELVVYARDHRRLEWGRGRKLLHTLARCSLLYFNIMPSRWRSSDWGYWTRPARMKRGAE